MSAPRTRFELRRRFAGGNGVAVPATDEAAGDGTVGIAEFGAILRRRWRLILTTTALVTGLGIAFLVVTKPIYSSSTAIFVDPRNRPSFQIEGTGTGAGFDTNLVDSQVVIIESQTVLRRVVEAEGLTADPDFARGNGTAEVNALKNLKEAVRVKRPEKTYIVEIEVRTREAEKSARLANAVGRAYLNDGRDSKSETARREGSWLETHIANLQNRLKDAENRVEAYKAENRLVGADGKLISEQRLLELNRSLVEVQRRTSESKAALDLVEQIRKTGRLPDATPDALKSTSIERLRQQLGEISRLDANSRSTLGPRHPAALEIREQLAEARKALRDELNRIADGARASWQVARANEASLEAQLEQLKRDSTNTSQTLVRLRELERAVEAQRAVYQKFLTDKEQIARLTVDTPVGRVIAPAVPASRAAFPNKALVLALALVGGGFAGIGLALAAETLARAGSPLPTPAGRGAPQTPAAPNSPATPGRTGRLGALIGRLSGLKRLMPAAGTKPATTADMPADLVLARLPAIAGKPALRWLAGRAAGPGAIAPQPGPRRAAEGPHAEAMAALASRLIAMAGDAEPLTILLTGTRRGAGTSTLALNLAWAFSEAGRRTLLIDADPGKTSLTAMPFAGGGLAADVFGRRLVARPLGTGEAAPLLLPFGAPPARGMAARSAIACPIVLIDGPAMDDPAFARLDLAAAIDGVLVALPPGSDGANPAFARDLEAAFGALLIGAVAREG